MVIGDYAKYQVVHEVYFFAHNLKDRCMALYTMHASTTKYNTDVTFRINASTKPKTGDTRAANSTCTFTYGSG